MFVETVTALKNRYPQVDVPPLITEAFPAIREYRVGGIVLPVDYPEHPRPRHGLVFWIHVTGCRQCQAEHPRPLEDCIGYFTEEHDYLFYQICKSRILWEEPEPNYL